MSPIGLAMSWFKFKAYKTAYTESGCSVPTITGPWRMTFHYPTHTYLYLYSDKA